jgi:glycosyltransferase involved in cell wall biosynthesis
MKLAIFHPAFGAVGGAELLAATQARYFTALGHTVKIVTFAFDSRQWRHELAGVPVTTIPWRHWTDLSALWSPAAKLRRRAQRAERLFDGAQVVLAHNYPCSAMLGSADITARGVWQCNEANRWLHPREANPVLTARVEEAGARHAGDWGTGFTSMLRRHQRDLARNSGRRALAELDKSSVTQLHSVYAISEFSRDIARRIYGRRTDTVVYPMVRFPQARRRRPGLDRRGLQVLVQSRLVRPKNVGMVLRGFALFRDRACSGAQLHIVGSGPQRRRLERLAARLTPPGSVRFHGFVSPNQLAAIYGMCDVFALLPVDEPFGMVFPEAAAHGLLLAGPDHGGPLEILDGGRLGWVCDAFSPDALAEALAEIWALDDASVDRRRIAADEACRARYAPDVVAPALLRLLEQAAEPT